MRYGYNGRILHVDLSKGRCVVEEPDETFFRTYLGGSAMGTYYLLKEMPAGVDALSPESVLTLFIGVTTGAAISGNSRICVNAKSPLTNAIGDAQAGGFFPAELKAAGFEGIVIKGRSPRPVYLWVRDGKAELRDATHLWGKVTGDAERMIREELDDPKIEVFQIGPAGEKMVRYACLINMCNRAAGRTGMGAVMGSKNLKAVAVRGHTQPPPKDKDRLSRLAKEGVRKFRAGTLAGLRQFGTPRNIAGQQQAGGLPTHNWTSGVFDGWEGIDHLEMEKIYYKPNDTCYGCVVRCKRVVQITEGPYRVDPTYGGPEYESLAALGSYCGVSSLPAVVKANEYCNKYGVDTISTGAVVAWAMDCFERGLLTLEDTDGIELRFGNADALVEIVRKICEREGFGDILAEGSLRAAQRVGKGAEELVVTGKGQELPAHMPEMKRSLALIYAVNPYGADHQSSTQDPSYVPGGSNERMAEIGLLHPTPDLTGLDREKVRLVLLSQRAFSLANSLSLCQFIWGPSFQLFSMNQLVEFVQAVTGWSTNLWELMRVGERAVNLQRAFNSREGFTSKDDSLPSKVFQPLMGGPTEGLAVNREEFERARRQYYGMAGWDSEGRPTRGKLEELDLDWLADMLYA